MTMLRIFVFLLAVVLGVNGGIVRDAYASESGEQMPRLHWRFDGPFGTYDRASLQRGFQIYREVCSSCHSMKRLYYRDLKALGYSDEEVKAVASEYMVMDGPDDEGEMFERPALPSDHFVSPFPNEKAAMASNNGALPPDMSLLAKARHGGADYIYSILTGYEDPPSDKELLAGQYWNRYMPGHVIAMAPPLTDGQVDFDDWSFETVEHYARDVAQFLAWASEPHMEARKRVGMKAFLFLLVFAGIAYAVKRRIWSKVH